MRSHRCCSLSLPAIDGVSFVPKRRNLRAVPHAAVLKRPPLLRVTPRGLSCLLSALTQASNDTELSYIAWSHGSA